MSLGVDLVPSKVCSLNCVYCEAGKTTKITAERKDYLPTNKIIAELKDYLNQKPVLDYITFSGFGEPTLHKNIGEIASFIKTNYPQYKLALITNSTLFDNAQFRKEILMMDLVLPSLDAASQEAFEKINRPVAGLKIQNIVKGLIEFRKEYKGKIWLEVFIIPGINDSPGEIELITQAVKAINPDNVQLNSLDRPGTEDWVKCSSIEKLEQIAGVFDAVPVEIIARKKNTPTFNSKSNNPENQILEAIKRRPCTLNDLQIMLNKQEKEIMPLLEKFLSSNLIESTGENRGIFYSIKKLS